MEFAGLKAIVTGGASGIGAATAALLQERGADVAVLDLNPDQAAGVKAIRCDVSDDASVRQAVEEAAGQLGGIDVVVNNAGVGAQGTIEANDDDEWHRVFDVNVLGMVRVSRAALPYLRRSSHAAIVTRARWRPPPGSPSAPCTAQPRVRCCRSRWPWPPTTCRKASGSTASTRGLRTPPGSAGSFPRQPILWRNGRHWKRASRTGGLSPRRKLREQWSTSPARSPVPPPGWTWQWTAACRLFGSAPALPRPDAS